MWDDGVEEEHHGTQDPDGIRNPELTGSLEATRESALKCDLPSCQSALSGDSTGDEDKTCTGEQDHGKMPTAPSPDEGVEQRPGLGLTRPELHELSSLSNRGWKNQSPGRVDQSSQVEHYLRRDKG